MNPLTLSSSHPAGFLEELKTPKTAAMIDILRNVNCQPENILVIGCGTGAEAGIFARAFQARTIGVDLEIEFPFNHAESAPAELMKMDARALKFSDETFDLIYSFHALEHIPNPKDALRELARVLRTGGRFLIGTPNKSRILGYFAAAHPIGDRVRMNLRDLGMRARGRWTNEAGAHAGFTARGLTSMCREAFGEGGDVSEQYYSRLYSSKARWVKSLCQSRLREVLLPCVYVSGIKAASPRCSWDIA